MRKIHWIPAILVFVLLALAAFFGVQWFFNASNEGLTITPRKDPYEEGTKALQNITSNQLGTLYEDTQNKYPSLDSKESYEQAIQSLFSNKSVEEIQMNITSFSENETQYQLHYNEEYLGTLTTTLQEDGSYKACLPIQGEESYQFEIPTGASVTVNGKTIGKEYILQENIPASNFFQFADQTTVPHVDVYELSNLLGTPQLTINGNDSFELLQDSITKRYLVGETCSDENLKSIMIQDAQRLAAYPARDIGLGAVTEIALTSSDWYQKYITLQNNWFTAHGVSNFSNQDVIKLIQQSDDTAVGYVVFDYYADNGEVNRTWHIGYQMTMVKTAQGWKVGGIEINNELNPNHINPEEE